MINEKILKSKKFVCSSGMSGEQKTINFDLPINLGDTGMSVICLKKFFDAGTGTSFGKKLKRNLSSWQISNFRQICLIAGWINKEFDGNIEDVPEFEFEVGSLQPATFVAMKIAGMGPTSLKDLNEHYNGYVVKKGEDLLKISNMFGFGLDEVAALNPQIQNPNSLVVGEKVVLPDYRISIGVFSDSQINFQQAVAFAHSELENSDAQDLAVSPDKDLLTNIPLSDAVNEPYKDSEYYYSVWDSGVSRAELPTGLESFIRQNSAKALKKATASLFGFYSKSRTWELDLRSNSGLLFQNLLRSQGRLEQNNNVYQATIEPVPPIEALGLRSPSDRVDVLAFQDLTEGASPVFASIAKVVMPDLKPRSTYKFIISVRADMFDSIPVQNKPVSDQVIAGNVSSNLSVCSDEDLVTMTGNFDVGDTDFEGMKPRLKSQRQLAKLKQLNFGSNKGEEIQREINEKIAEINRFELAEFRERLDETPFVVYYNISSLQKDIKSIHKMMIDYDGVLTKTKEFGVSISPDVSLQEEAEKLSLTLGAIKKLGDYNNVSISEDNLDTLVMSYRIITNGPEDGDKVQGLEVKSVSVLKDSSGVEVFNTGMGNFVKSSPITSRTTMGYLAMLNILKRESARHASRKMQGVEVDRADVLAFLNLYHLPKPVMDFTNVDLDFNTTFGSTIKDLDFSVNKIRGLADNLSLNYNLTNNIDILNKIKLRTFEIEKFREFMITDKLPININFGSLDDLFTEFFDRYDMLSLFVDFGQMVPDFEVCEPDWDFDFSVPKLPRMPTFDPIEFIVRQLNLAIQDLLLSILSSIVKMILKFLSNSSNPVSGFEDYSRKVNMGDIFPEMDVYEFGDPSLKDIKLPGFTDLGSKGIIGNPGLMNRMRAAGKKLGLPSTAIGELPKLFDNITNVCTPTEIFDLLNGVPTPEVSKVVLNVAKGSCGSLSKNINDTTDIVKICRTVGDLVNPSVKDKLKTFSFGAPFSEINIPCPDDIGVVNSDKQIRDTLERLNASPEEVERSIADARKRRDSIKNFFTKNPVAAQMPGGKNGLAGLPSPYENENMNRLTELAAEGVFGNVEAVFMSEVSGFVPLLYAAQTRLLTVDDHDYDHIGMAEYFYVKRQIDRGQETLTKPGVIVFRDTETIIENGDEVEIPTSPFVKEVENGPPFDLEDRVDSNLLQQIMMRPMNSVRQSLEVFPEFYRYLNDPRTNFVGSSDERLSFAVKNVVPAVDTDITNFAERGYNNKKFNVLLSDKFYHHTPVDCFEVTRTPRIFDSVEEGGMATFTYNQELSPEMSALIATTRPDADSDPKKLLRPEAFAKLLCDSVVRTIELAEQRRTEFSNSGPIHNYYDNDNRFPDVRFDRENVIYDKIIGKGLPGPSEPEAFYKAGQYAFTAQRIMDTIAKSVRKSKFFNKQELELLSEKISSKYIEDFSNGIRCLKKTKGVIDFEEVRKSALEDYRDSLSREENNPLNRDFSKPGPLEESFADQLVFLYIKTFVVEFALKSIFISSRFSLEYMLGQKFVYDFFVDYMLKTLEKEFANSKRYKINFYDQIKKIANVQDEQEAISSLVAKIFESTKNEIRKITNELFESDYASFHEEYFNIFAREFKRVPKFSPYGSSRSKILEVDFEYEDREAKEDDIDSFLSQELKKNAGFFYPEYYFKFENPYPNNSNYIAKCLGYYRRAFPDQNLSSTRWPYLYRKLNSNRQSSTTGTELHYKIQGLSAHRIARTDMHSFLQSVFYHGGNTNGETYQFDGRTYHTPYGLAKNFLKIGIRLVYVSGRNQQFYESILLEDGPSTTAELVGIPNLNPILGISSEEGRELDIFDAARNLNNVSWGELYNPNDYNLLADAGQFTDSASDNNRPEYRNILNSMKLGPTKFKEHFKEKTFPNNGFVQLQSALNNTFELANHEILIDCIDNFSNKGLPAREIRNAYKDKLLEEFFGLGPEVDGKRSLDKSKIQNENVKVLFNDVFPLDRMASMYFLNEHGFFDSTEKFADLLGGTRGAIRSTYRILKNKGASSEPGEFGIGDKTQVPPAESYSVINANMTTNGPSGDMADNLIGDIAPQIPKIVAQTPITLIRGLANSLDPGYAKMSKISSEDPCLLRDGAAIASLKTPMYTFPSNKINGGLKGDQYVPVTIGAPVDIGLSVALMSNPFSFAFGLLGLTNSLTHTVNSISGDSTNKAYGAPLTPLGLLALSLPQMTGESPNRRRREANCAANDNRDPVRDTKGNVIDGNGVKQELQRCEDEEES